MFLFCRAADTRLLRACAHALPPRGTFERVLDSEMEDRDRDGERKGEGERKQSGGYANGIISRGSVCMQPLNNRGERGSIRETGVGRGCWGGWKGVYAIKYKV